MDVSHQLQLLRQAKDLAKMGKHVLVVIHDLSHGLESADRVVLMDGGNAVIEGTPEEVYQSGTLERVLGVKVSRVRLDDEWHYLCTEK